jgi:NAD(P)H-flavin reductase
MPFTATVLSNQNAALSVHLLRLRVEGDPFAFKAGQFVIIPVPQRPEDAKPPKGFYSIASSDASPELELLVEHRTGGGYVSEWVSARQPGDNFEIQGPMGHFGLLEPLEKDQVFLGFRAGVAPLRSMILSALAAGGDRQVWLFLGAEDAQDLLLDAQWKALDEKDPRFHYRPCKEPAVEALKNLRRKDLRFYLAGFSRDVVPLQDQLLAAGIPVADIKVEKFG